PVGDDAMRAAWARQFRHVARRACGGEEPANGPSPHHVFKGQHKHGALVTSYTTAAAWDGYVANGSGFDMAEAHFTVPSYSGSVSGATAAEWVGIGGYTGDRIWQAGVENDPVNGTKFWYEAFPSPPVYLSASTIGVAAGNTVFAYVDYNYTFASQ